MTVVTTNLWFGGRLIQKNGVTTYEDRLQSAAKYFPYGEDRYNPTPANPSNDQEKFATYTRDAISGLDYAVNRYYGAGLGRFMSADPSTNNIDSRLPITWNGYTYANGDPADFGDPSGLGIPLPPVVPGYNCSTSFIDYAAEFGETIQQLFNTGAGILGVMNYFEEEGSGSIADQQVWAALDWTFLNQWNLSASDKAWFYGPSSIPASFVATVTTGAGRSQVFTSAGNLTPGFYTQLINILTGSPDSTQCSGLAVAFDVAQGTIDADNGEYYAGLLYIPDPVPAHSNLLLQVACRHMADTLSRASPIHSKTGVTPETFTRTCTDRHFCRVTRHCRGATRHDDGQHGDDYASRGFNRSFALRLAP